MCTHIHMYKLCFSAPTVCQAHCSAWCIHLNPCSKSDLEAGDSLNPHLMDEQTEVSGSLLTVHGAGEHYEAHVPSWGSPPGVLVT